MGHIIGNGKSRGTGPDGDQRLHAAYVGETQAERYLDGIQDCCEQLAANPMLGRACDEIRPGLRRMQEGKHVIFYRIREDGIFVSRILHQSMHPESRSMPSGA